MQNPSKILFISNGHGEDLIGAQIAASLRLKSHNLKIEAFPIVGEGKPYQAAFIKTIGPKRIMPSGGFFYQSLWLTLKDLFAGLIGHSWEQIKTLWKARKKYDLVFGIGDIVPIILCSFSGSPFMFHGSAKTAYYRYNYTPWEKWLLKKNCLLTFPRDSKTTEMLKDAGIKVKYVGNPMMDCLKISGEDFGISPDSTVIGLLPGSREDAYINLEDLEKVSEEIKKQSEGKNVEFLVALAPNLEQSNVPSPKNIAWKIIQGKFGDVLNRSNLIIGLSGTGNEQAVGLGKPLISFPSRGTQHTQKFAKMKQELFNEAALLLSRDPKIIAKEVWNILKNPQRIKHMQEAGKERMGGPGAVEKMVEIICASLS